VVPPSESRWNKPPAERTPLKRELPPAEDQAQDDTQDEAQGEAQDGGQS
jgi:hypothetical protein